jgi:hypothetical protein
MLRKCVYICTLPTRTKEWITGAYFTNRVLSAG